MSLCVNPWCTSQAKQILATFVFVYIYGGLGPARVLAQNANSSTSLFTDVPVVQSDDDSSHTVDQSPENNEESEIVVRGTLWRKPFVQYFDISQLRTRGHEHIGRLLEGEAGVELVESPKMGVLLQMGGFDTKAVSVYVEGIPFLEPFSGLADVSQLPVGLFCSVTVHRGIVPVTLGTDTLGARVDLHVSDCPQNGVFAFVQAGARSIDVLTWRTAVSGRFHRGTWTFFGAVDGMLSDGYPLSAHFRTTVENAAFPDNGGLRDASSRKQFSTVAGFTWAPSRFSFTMLAMFLRAPRDIPPHMQSGYLRYWTLSPNDSLLLGMRAHRFWDRDPLRYAWGMLFAHLHRDRIDDWEDLSHFAPTTNPSAFFVSSEYKNTLFGADTGMRFHFWQNQQLEVVALWRLIRHDSQEKPVTSQGFHVPWQKYDSMWAHRITLAAENRSSVGVWTFGEGLSGGMLQLIGRNLRGETYDVDETPMPGIEGHAQARRDFGQTWAIETATGYKIRYPTLKELFSNRVGGNPQLDPERAILAQGTLQLRQGTHGWLDGRLTAARVMGLIDRWGETYQNLEDAWIAAAELEGVLKWKKLQLFGRYRWQTAKLITSGKTLPGRARHRGKVGVEGHWNKLSASVDFDARSSVTLQYYNVEDGLFHEGISTAQVRLNARIRYEIALSAYHFGYVQLRGRNLLDVSGEEGTFEPRAGREFWLEVGLQY